ncbi:Apolipoprotein D [Portunus trituberculatus]|uniref:Apolipoprotein D n=1 Tax=Portunus trituberculatus TaxID=210409 RepID=A0A5B7F1F6_PORTR|nr:Apolipoprotein D [Portunus trituberculatus]
MKATITSLLLAVVVALSEAKVGALRHVSTGKCPTITNKQDLEVAPYLGRWYEIERFEARFEEGMDCVHVDYTDLDIEGRNPAKEIVHSADEVKRFSDSNREKEMDVMISAFCLLSTDLRA